MARPGAVRTSDRRRLAAVALALSAGLAMTVLSGAVKDPASAAEGRYLALVSTLALLVILELGRDRSAPLLWLLPLLPSLALVVLPAGGARGLGVSVPLSVGLAWGIAGLAERSARVRPEPVPALGQLLVAAVGLQILALSETLLSPALTPLSLLRWVGLPAVAAIAVWGLARRLGSGPALLALAYALLVSGHLGRSAVAALLVLAAAVELRARRASAWQTALSVAALLVTLVVLLPGVVLAPLLLLAGLALLLGRSWPAAALVLAALASQIAPVRPWTEAAPELLLLVPLLPGLWLQAPGVSSRGRLWALVACTLLALVSLRSLPPREALIAPAALLALLPPAWRAGERDAEATPVRAASPRFTSWCFGWCTLVLAFALVATGYPWLRDSGVDGLADLATETRSRLLSGFRFERLPLLTWPPELLDADRPELSLPLQAWSGRAQLVLDSAVANGAELAAGTVVAVVRLRRGSEVRQWPLRIGAETGEWAAARSDLAGRVAAPEPWISWVDGSGEFFGQRYRARLELDGLPAKDGQTTVLELVLAPDLPRGVTLTAFHLDLRPSG